MKLFILMLMFVGYGWCDVTATPSTISKMQRASPSNDGAAPQMIMPARVQVVLDLTPSESWTVTKGGTLSTSCNGWGGSSGPCFEVEDTSGNAYADGTGSTGDATVVIRWRLFYTVGLAAGTYTGTVTVNPATGSDVVINITLIVVAPESYLPVTYKSGYPLAGCTNSQAIFYNYTDTCGIPDAYPPDLDFSIPAVGGSYTDARFGGTITRLTTKGYAHAYSTRSPLSINNTYLLVNDSIGALQVINVATQAITYANVPAGNISATYWSPIAGEDEVLYWLDGGTVKKRVLNTSTTSTVKDMTGAPWNFTAITDGGTSKPSSNGFLAFWNPGTTDVCALKLATATVYCADYSGVATFSNIDFVEVEHDGVQNKTYVKFVADPMSPQWEVNTGTGVLDLIGSFDELNQSSQNNIDGDGICEASEACLGQPHATTIRDMQGRVHMFWAASEAMGSDNYFATAELSKGAGMYRPVEETGGGLRWLQAFNANGDSHFGGSLNGAGVVSTYQSNITAKVISAATSANPAVITVTSHGYSNGQVKVIGSATGNTCINGVWTLANVTANTFELSGSTCSGAGTYDANTGHVATGVAPAASSNADTIFLVIPGTTGYIRPLAQHRSIAYEGGGLSSCCNGSPRAAISMDGTKIIFASNMGVPEGSSLYMLETGFTPNTTILNGGIIVSGGVVVH